MKSLRHIFLPWGALMLFIFSLIPMAQAAPYYSGTYDGETTDTANPPSTNPPASPSPNDQPAPPPPVVYRRRPVYRRAYPAPDWAYPGDAALAPWPWNFDVGGGPTIPVGSKGQYNTGSNFTIGGGYNFSPEAGFVLEFSNAWLGLSDSDLAQKNATDGHANIWSMTLDPVWRFRLGGGAGAYIIGGGGYYQRQETFDVPGTAFIPFFGFVPVDEQVRQTDDAGGLNIGAGLTFNLGWGAKFFMEARYHHIFTPGTATQIIPVTFGLRW